MTRMRFERQKRGWSQTKLAAEAGRLQMSDISKIERGWMRPSPNQAERLGAVLGIAAAELLEPVAAPEALAS
jgi:ribosome-binding protein aMBF1 (putative translation factor)